MARRRSVGAELADRGVDFRVWAPSRSRVEVVIGSDAVELEREDGGYFSGTVSGARAGTRYRFRLDGERETFPDPASRYQPDGPHGDSVVVDPQKFRWRDAGWRGMALKGRVIYELHVGTFTPDGTFAAASACLQRIADLGIDLIEVMPVNDFAGRFGWGYDGVDLWAPYHVYGTPDDFRRFVDTAHSLGVGVMLDVVYNHFGPDGCYMSKFGSQYFTKKYRNDWGDAINFDDDDADGVREFFAENAAYWIDEFHLDGLRIDATQAINDESGKHILAEITDRARAAAGDRSIVVIAENEPQDVAILDEYGLDALWNDDWHHAACVATTGKTEAYYTDYRGKPQEFVSMAKFGFLFQGQRYKWQKKRRGTPSFHLAPERFVCYLQNHDQVANSAFGERLDRLTSPGRLRAMTALLLLQPQTPMLFQGQEFGTPSPFLYFADHKPELARKVASGRREFLDQFPSVKSLAALAEPDDPQTFEQSKLVWEERPEIVALHRDLIALRRNDAVISQQRNDNLAGAVIADEAFVLRWLGDDTRLLVVNLGRELHLDPAPEPLLAGEWKLLWSSESPEYGGSGTAPLADEWLIPAHSAMLLTPDSRESSSARP